MRLLHTSDWHLGQTLYGFERSYEQRCFLHWLLDTLESERIDALLIAGDIFDNPNPSADAQQQFYQFLNAAKQRLPDLDIVIIAGNHDSAGRLEAPSALLNTFRIHVVGCVRAKNNEFALNRLVVPLHNAHGEIAAWCLAIPFLRLSDLPHLVTDGDAYLEGVRLLYRQALEYAEQQREADQALIALGHCHVRGGAVSEDSERRIVIGGAEALPVEIFDPLLTYTALGHLHRAQRVGGREAVRYSGSPLPMSFNEVAYPHQVVRVDLNGATLEQVVALPIAQAVELLRIPRQPASFDEVAAALTALEIPARSLEQQPFLQVRVRLETPDPGLRVKVETLLQGKPVRLAWIESTYNDVTTNDDIARPQSLDDLNRLQPVDMFVRLYQSRYQTAPSPALCAALQELVNAED